MSTFQARTGVGAGTVNVELADLPGNAAGQAIEHVVLGADGNPIVPVLDASMQALADAVVASVAAVQARSALKPVVTAGIDLSAHRALMFDPNGNAIPADPTSLAYSFAGISLAAASNGTLASVALTGPMSDPSWGWTPQQPIFVAPGGVLTQVVPTTGFLHQLGIAMSAVAIFLAPGTPILRS